MNNCDERDGGPAHRYSGGEPCNPVPAIKSASDDHPEYRFVLAIDIGSSSIRCSGYRLYDDSNIQGMEMCASSTEYRVVNNLGQINLSLENEKRAEITSMMSEKEGGSCSAFLFDEIDKCVDDTLMKLRRESIRCEFSFQVVGLGITSMVMNLIGVDEKGNILGSHATLTYACNSPHVKEQCQRLRDNGSKTCFWNDLYQKTGTPLHSAYALPQFLSFYQKNNRHSPKRQKHSQVHKWQTLASICLARWTGCPELPISFSEASWTGLFNFRTCTWEQQALDLLPQECQDALPHVIDYNDTDVFVNSYNFCGIGPTKPDGNSNVYWDKWKELRGHHIRNRTAHPYTSDDGNFVTQQGGCRLFLGLGDGVCANVGSKCTTPSRISVTIGTSAAARVCLPFESNSNTTQMVVPPGLFCYRIDKSHILLGGALTDGGSVIEWARQLLNLKSKDDFEKCLISASNLLERDYENVQSEKAETASLSHTFSSDLTMIPFLSGERSTGFRDGARGAILGLTRDTSPAHLLKSCLEGVIIRLHAIVSLIREATRSEAEPPRLIISGAALEKNQLWRNMLADCCGLIAEFDCDATESTSRGVARMVVVALQSNNDQQTLQHVEIIQRSIMSDPHGEYKKLYWSRAAATQNGAIQSISPLW